ncbi:odorant receptor 291 [Nasonia vitripennis]|uniref:Odorant receptor n=1 Tax=Nasonia vitripennis TaxID=7425 RepID=A0A7M6UMU0_NASVI|nr:odorant receptor 291 [Nasonia vitripennis]
MNISGSEQTILAKYKNDLQKASKILTWNRRLLSLLGLWPESPMDLLFCASAVYYIFYLGLIFVSFVLYLKKKILNVSIFIALLSYGHISARLLLLRRHNRTFGVLFAEMKQDYELRNYKSDQELRVFLKYNILAKSMIKFLLFCSTFFAIVFYVKPLLMTYNIHRAIRKSHRNATAPFVLAQNSFYQFYKITTVKKYAINYVSMLPFSVLTGFINCATDCLVLTIGCHLSGRLAALSHRIRNVEFCNGSQEFKAVIRLHQQVLRIGDMVENSLNTLMTCHILTAGVIMCFILYKTLIYLRPGKRIHLIHIVILLSLNIVRLYFHCCVGEFLMQESRVVHEAFFECKWYTMLLQDRKLIVLNLLRSQRPIRFAARGLGTFSIELFSEVLKSSLGYLSVLRNVI